jgi:hypothetical protein
MRAIACHNNELPKHLRWVVVPFRRWVTAPEMARRRGLRQETRERGPRRAAARWARRGVNCKALFAIETQGELSQWEMHPRSKYSSTANHRRVTSGTGTGASEPVAPTVASVSLVKSCWPGLRNATPSAVSRARRARFCHHDNQRAGRAAGVRPPRGQDPRAATGRPEARRAPRSTGARRRAVAEKAFTSLELEPSIRQDSTANPIPE